MKLGTDEFGKVFLGDDYVERIYQGDDQIYSVYKDPKDSEIVFRPTDNKGQLSVSDPYFGYAKIDCIKGKSLVWNQLCSPITITESEFTNGVKVNTNGNAVIVEIASGGATALRNIIIIANYYRRNVNGTYRLFRGEPDNAKNAGICILNSYTAPLGNHILPPSGNAIEYGLRIPQGTPAGIYIFYPQIIDLTLMFGAGNEPSTVAEFESMFPLPYYPYNPGTLISNDAETLETVGFNQLVSEPLNLVTTRFFPSFDKNIYTRVFGGIPYYFRISAPQIANWRFAYKLFDLDGNEITVGAFASIGVATPYYNTSNNCWIDGTNHPVNQFALTFTQDCYVYFGYGAGAVTADTKMENANLNISDPSKNGTYEPYWKSSLPLNLDYLPIKSHNIWDEEWENGDYAGAGGVPVETPRYIRSKNFIQVLPSTTYCLSSIHNQGTSTRQFVVYFHDENKNFINYQSVDLDNKLFTTPSNCYYIHLRNNIADVSYAYDICLNLSDPDFNGQYEPYALRGGLKGTGTAYDLGKVEDDGYIHEVTKVMGEVDLGSLNWEGSNGSFQVRNFVTEYGVAINGDKNYMCAAYPVYKSNIGAIGVQDADKVIVFNIVNTSGYYPINALIVRDTAYTSATAFKTAMSGVMLYYELATPITYELVTPIKAIYKVDKRGTEQATFPTHSDETPSTPLCAEIGYPK